jgi:hypothetical protein
MPDPYPHHDLMLEERPQRVSALAVSSLVFGILCCIPGLGLIAVILGAAGLIQIRDPEKRLSGKSLAIVGIILGGLGTLGWVVTAGGALQFMNSLRVYGSVVESLQDGKYADVRSHLSPSANSGVNDARLKEVASTITAEWGHYRSMPKGLFEWMNGYTSQAEAVNKAVAAAGVAAPGGSLLPLPITFDQGKTIAVFILDPRAPSSAGSASIENFGLVDKSGKLIWLIEPTRGPPGGTGPTAPTGGAGSTGPSAPSGATSPSGR